ncbi:kelch-like protein 10 [Centroberyx affinis]|uniref:kelch-like protein 10 n=1 Tax=Centroberyx affinis TaxID=166261 RepID=UPI003A5BCF1E
MKHCVNEASNNPVFIELRLEGKLCDAVIRVDGVTFNVHKIILCGCSPYFRSLFTHGWSSPQQWLYDIPGVSANMMRLLIEFAYTGSVPVTVENVEELLAAADQLFFMGVVRACCQFLEEQLCPQNCIGIWKFVDTYYCPNLRRKAFLYILRHFEEVSEELLTLSLQRLADMADIFMRDDLNMSQQNVAHCAHHAAATRRLAARALRLQWRQRLRAARTAQRGRVRHASRRRVAPRHR